MLEINGKKVRMVLDISSAIGYEVGASIRLKIKKPSGVEADVVVTTVSGRQR